MHQGRAVGVFRPAQWGKNDAREGFDFQFVRFDAAPVYPLRFGRRRRDFSFSGFSRIARFCTRRTRSAA